MATKTETFSVRLTGDTKRQVDEIARRLRRSRSFVIQEAVESYVRDRERYLGELDAALASVEAQGGHSADSVFRWIRSWGTDHELPIPDPDVPPLK
jgi:predicted transcriptional regulator